MVRKRQGKEDRKPSEPLDTSGGIVADSVRSAPNSQEKKMVLQAQKLCNNVLNVAINPVVGPEHRQKTFKEKGT